MVLEYTVTLRKYYHAIWGYADLLYHGVILGEIIRLYDILNQKNPKVLQKKKTLETLFI